MTVEENKPYMKEPKIVIMLCGVLVLFYLTGWLFGDHGHTYYVEPAKAVDSEWVCLHGESGPFWDNGKDRDPVCHEPVRQCPALWFPYVTQVPCRYKDPLGGPYTKQDLDLLQELKQQRR